MEEKKYNANEDIFSKILRAGRRTYFFDVRSTKAGVYYLTISESKKFTEEYQNVDKTLCQQLTAVVCALYEEGVFIAQVDARTLGEVLWNNINQMFTDYISDDAMTLGALKSALRRQTEALLLLAMRP